MPGTAGIGPAPSDGEIRAHLQHVLASPSFAAAGRLRALLSYAVQQSLAGARDQLKETVIGVEVFGREPSYDPRVDPVVRVMAGRLRARLARYYETGGAAESLRIEFPKGAYVPRFAFTTVPPVPHEIPSVAVLPFTPLSAERTDEFFAHGMTDAIITELAKLSGLRVISRTSVLRFRTGETPVPEIARLLNVGHVLEGSVLRDGGRVRITAQLIGYPPERHLWAESYERPLAGVLALQAGIAQRVAAEIHVRLSPEEARALAARPAVNTQAYMSYLEGKHAWRRVGDPHELRAGLAHLEQAVRIEPRFTLAHAALADGYLALARHFGQPEMAPRARAAAGLALSLDPDDADARASLLQCFIDAFEWRDAQREAQRAIAANPGHALSRVLFGQLLLRFGRLDEGVAQLMRACVLDPLSGSVNDALALGLFRARRNAEALAQARRAWHLDTRCYPTLLHLAILEMENGLYDDALRSLDELRSTGFTSSEVEGIAGRIHALAGRPDEARCCLQRLQRMPGAAPHSLAHILGALGDTGAALDHLERAVEQKSFLAGYLKVDPIWDAVRPHPRFAPLVRRLNLP